MRRSRARWVTLALIPMLLAASLVSVRDGQPFSSLAQAAVQPQDTPTTVLADGVSSYSLASPKLFWATRPSCNPAAPTGGAHPATNTTSESISRIAIAGSPARMLFSNTVGSTCGQQNLQINSDIIADANYVYWIGQNNTLVRLSTNANVGDPPAMLATGIGGPLVQDGDSIFTFISNGPGLGISIVQVAKADGRLTPLTPNAGSDASALSTDGEYVFWISGGVLHRFTLADSTVANVASGVYSYYAEGPTQSCGRTFCLRFSFVWFSVGGQIYDANNYSSGTIAGPIYSSSIPNASIYNITSDNLNVFFFEDQPIPCAPSPCFPSHTYVLYRTARSPGTTAAPLYAFNSFTAGIPGGLTQDGSFLFWQLNGALLELPKNASTLPLTNMRATGLEVTQGIQGLNNTVMLVQNKRTFVRFYVQSDGPPVPGVTATLSGSSQLGGFAGVPLYPVNSVGSRITVLPAPNRNNLNDSFVFELPWDWTTVSDLQLSAVVNPYRIPLQQTYDNNAINAGPFAFQTSPRLAVQFVAWGYTLNNQTYYPRLAGDIVQTYSWIRRAYPLASSPGFSTDPSPGFRPNLWLVNDAQLGAKVNQTSPECTNNLCASAYTNAQMAALRTENGLSSSLFFYGMISDAGGTFPRGQACCGTNVSSGPAGIPSPTSLGNGWDTDGTYGDWYAAHEIGHTLGRGHPGASPCSKDTNGNCIGYCSSIAGDLSYPYNGAAIGPSDNSIEGFDAGDPDRNINIARAVYPSSIWTDVMSYCSNQWISDYTYTAMYNYMIAHPSLSARGPTTAQLTGDWLSVFGTIQPLAATAQLFHLRHLKTVGSIPPRVPGPYSIRLLDAHGVATNYPFTGDTNDDSNPPSVSFGQVVPFVAGTRTVQIVRIADGHVMVAQSINPDPPTLSQVALVNAAAPVVGTVTLGWTASDPDGAALTFDVLYSRDQGTSFQPLKLHVTGTSTAIDTSRLGGGNGMLRVIASDGVNSAQAESAPFTMAVKPPMPTISTPGDGGAFHYGQLINFSGAAEDLQDGSVATTNLQWSSDGSPIGVGALLSFTDFKVGQHTIMLTATNSAGMSASSSILINVDDDLSLPGPTLTVGPGQVGWQVAPGTTATQTAAVGIDNSGSGTLSWSASTDASWLTLGATGGTAPSMLTLLANPSGIANGTTLVATVTINSPASGSQPAQQVIVHVTLAAGNVHDPIGGLLPPRTKVFVPLVRR